MALGESIVAIGVGASGTLNLGIGTAAVLGVFLASALWWTYFDVVALISARRLGEAEPGRTQNELARDSYSYIHLLLVRRQRRAGAGLIGGCRRTDLGDDRLRAPRLRAEP